MMVKRSVGTAFKDQTGLTYPILDLRIFKNMTTTANQAFKGISTNVTYVIFPESLVTIGEAQFDNVSARTIIYYGNISQTSWISFNTYSTYVLYGQTSVALNPNNGKYKLYVKDELVQEWKSKNSNAIVNPISEWIGIQE